MRTREHVPLRDVKAHFSPTRDNTDQFSLPQARTPPRGSSPDRRSQFASPPSLPYNSPGVSTATPAATRTQHPHPHEAQHTALRLTTRAQKRSTPRLDRYSYRCTPNPNHLSTQTHAHARACTTHTLLAGIEAPEQHRRQHLRLLARPRLLRGGVRLPRPLQPRLQLCEHLFHAEGAATVANTGVWGVPGDVGGIGGIGGGV